MKVQVLILTFFIASSLQNTGCRINRTTPNLKQCASPWGTQPLLGTTSTICQKGSMVTILAEVFQSLGKTINGQVVTPEVLSEAIKQDVVRMGIETTLGGYGFTSQGTVSDTNSIKNHICANNVVMLINDATGNVVLATGFENETYLVNDPTDQNREIYATTEGSRAFVYSL